MGLGRGSPDGGGPRAGPLTSVPRTPPNATYAGGTALRPPDRNPKRACRLRRSSGTSHSPVRPIGVAIVALGAVAGRHDLTQELVGTSGLAVSVTPVHASFTRTRQPLLVCILRARSGAATPNSTMGQSV